MTQDRSERLTDRLRIARRLLACWLMVTAGCAADASGLVLPTLDTVGILPAKPVIVELGFEVGLSIDRVPMTISVAAGELRRIAGTSRSSPVVLRIDARVRWGFAQTLLMACRDAKLPHVYFATRSAASDWEGATAAFLPSDGPADDEGPTASYDRLVDVHLDTDSVRGAEPLATVYARLDALESGAARRTFVRIVPDADTCTGDALRAFDAALRSGVGGVGFVDAAPSDLDAEFWRADSIEALARVVARDCRPSQVRIDGDLPAAPAVLPTVTTPSPRRDRTAGQTWQPRLPIEEHRPR